MKPNDRLSLNALQRKFHPFVKPFALALCLVALGVVILFSSPGITGVQKLDAIRARERESPLVKVVEPRREATHQVETPELSRSASREVYLDPVTGKIGPPPPSDQSVTRRLSQEEENALSTSGAGLVQTPLTGPTGGVKIDLQGRFRSQVVATLDSHSNLSIQCAPGTAGSEDSSHQKNTDNSHGASPNKATHREK